MTDGQLMNLANILNALGMEYDFTAYRDFRIQTPTEEYFTLVDALMVFLNVGEWSISRDETWIEIPSCELPQPE